MSKRKYYSLVNRIEIAESASKYGIQLISSQSKIKENTINKWIKQIDFLKQKRDDQLIEIRKTGKDVYANLTDAQRKRKSQVDRLSAKRFYEKHTFKLMVKNLNRNLRKRGYEISHEVKAISLWSIVKKQKCKCAISGIKLTKYNMSIDHIIPLSKGGTSNINNIQIVERHVNIMKNDKSLKELLFYCNKIIENNISA